MGITIKKKVPAKELVQAVATIEKQHKDGSATTEKEVVSEAVFDGPHATVGLSMGLTKNLGNYESLKITVSLYYPCYPDESAVDAAFHTTKEWVDGKLNAINDEVNATLG